MENANVSALKKALAYLEKRHQEWARGVSSYTPIDFQTFYDLLADEVIFEVPTTTPPPDYEAEKPIDQRTPPWNVIGCTHHGKQALINAFNVDQSDTENWEIQRPIEYLTDGANKVVALLSERYLKMDTPVPWSESAMLFEFENGKIIRYTHLADMSGHLGAIHSAAQHS